MLGLLAYISVAGAWFWARSLHPAIVTWPTRIATGTRRRRKPVGRGGVHPGWRHATQPQERGCRQGWGCCPAPGGNDWPPTFGSSRGTKAAKGDAELLTPALGPSKDDTCHRTAGRLAGAHAGKCRLPPLGCPPDTIQTASSFLESSPSTRNVHRVGFAGVRAGKRGVCKRGETCPCRGVAGRTCMALARRNCRRRIVLRDPAHGIQICAMSKNVSRAAGQHIICR